jgi:hypothetical protein
VVVLPFGSGEVGDYYSYSVYTGVYFEINNMVLMTFFPFLLFFYVPWVFRWGWDGTGMMMMMMMD